METGQNSWREANDIFLDEGPSAHEGHSARGFSSLYPFPSFIEIQIFVTTQFEGLTLLHTKALQAAFEWMGHALDKHLQLAERTGKHDRLTVAYFQIAVELPPNRIIVLNLKEFQRIVFATLTELYPVYAQYVSLRNITVERLLEIWHLCDRDPLHNLWRRPPAPTTYAFKPVGYSLYSPLVSKSF